ncbi:MAG: hypothetical protein VZS44_10610 [Bacilli bacterium]|nr:hypothetical protein [Bacilli bacterium]
MYWKLIDRIEYDYGDMPMSTSTFIGAVMAINKDDAIFWFNLLHRNGIITIPSVIQKNIRNSIEECTIDEYIDFMNTIK